MNKKGPGDSTRRIDRLGTKTRIPPKKKAEIGTFDRSLIRVTMEDFTYGKKFPLV
jgi:hypothetical protein